MLGDYDVDGVAATALLAAVLRACGLAVETLLPHRLREGYGFRPVHVERARERGCRVLVTADCGSTSHEAAAAALDAGLDLIVTDHHRPGAPLPAGVVEINPQRAECSYPFAELSGAGLAFKLASGFARHWGRPVDPTVLLRVACLGTICDLVPLTGENRVIAALGLAALPATPSPGLQALIAQARLRPPLRANDVGIRLGPRLNAAGRLADAGEALELLLTRDPDRARRLAERLEGLNDERRETERRTVEEAVAAVEARQPLARLLTVWDPGWHQGVVGIAASRLARRFHRPVVLWSVHGESATGSGRSVSGIDLHGFLAPWRDRLERFGGHAQAIGLTAAVGELESLRDEWEEAAAAWDPALLDRRLEYELDLPAAAIDDELLATLRRLEPFGPGNPQPLLKVGPLRLAGAPRHFGRGHVAADAVDDSGSTVRLLGWRWRERLDRLAGPFEALGCVEEDRLRGGPQLRLVDARPPPAAETPANASAG